MKIGQVKFGPFSLRSFLAHMNSDPSRQASGPHQLYCPGPRLNFQHFRMSCHCKGVSCWVSVTPRSFCMRVSCKGVKIEGTRNANKPRRSNSYTKSIEALTSSSVSPGLPTISVIIGNQLLRLAMVSPFTRTLGQSSMGNGTPLLGMIFLAMRTDPVSRPINGHNAFFRGC